MRTVRDRTADFLVVLSGPEERVEELQNHFADERAAGRSATASDVASLLPGAARTIARRALKDVFFWPVGIPLALIMVVVLASSYPLGWVYIGVDDFVASYQLGSEDIAFDDFGYTTAALRSKAAVDIAFLIGPLVAIPASARMFQRLTMGRWSVAGVVASVLAAFVTAVVLLGSGADSFERPQEVNEVPALLTGTFILVASLPVIYLITDTLARMRNLWTASSPQRS